MPPIKSTQPKGSRSPSQPDAGFSSRVAAIPQDVAFGLRMLARQPAFTAVVVISLALGIGFNTAIFSFLNAIFLHPFPAVRDPARLVSVFDRDANGAGLLPTSYLNFKDLRSQTQVFSGLAAHQVTQVGVALGGQGEQMWGEMVSANYFDVLGVKPALGRTFRPEEDVKPGAYPVVVLSHQFWTQRLGGDPAVVGRTLRLNNREFTIIGVAPRNFNGSNVVVSPLLWVPTMMYRQVFAFSEFFDQRTGRVLQLVGRLRPGATPRQAQAEMNTLASRLATEYPEDNKKLTLVAMPYTSAALPMDRREVFVRAGGLLVGVVALLLLIACVNVANLLLARTLARRKEIALRLSLGAGKGRLVQQLLTESLLLAILAGGVGLLFAVWTRQLLWKFKPPYFTENALAFSLDPQIILFTVGVSLLATLLFGTASALETTKPDLVSALKEEGRSLGPPRAGLSLRWLTISVQVALCLVCLTCAGFFLRSLRDAQKIDPGFDAAHLLAVSFDLRAQGYDEARAREFQERLLERVRALPEVQAATLADNRLLGGWTWFRKVPLEGAASDEDGVMAGSTLIGPDYFQTAGIQILRGRSFSPQDRTGAHPVSIVDETLAQRAWPGRDPVGKFVHLDNEKDPVEIVGIARNVKYRSLGEAPQPFLYLPLLQRGSLRCTLHVSARRPGQVLEAVKREIRRLDPLLPINEARPLSEVIARSLWAPRAGAVVLSIFGVVALILAAVGVYGVTAYSVGQRRSEMGLRMALGARRGQIVQLVLTRGMSPLGVGLAAGLAASVAINRWIASLLYSGEVVDRISIPLAAAVLAFVGLLANLIPAARAARIDPSREIRGD